MNIHKVLFLAIDSVAQNHQLMKKDGQQNLVEFFQEIAKMNNLSLADGVLYRFASTKLDELPINPSEYAQFSTYYDLYSDDLSTISRHGDLVDMFSNAFSNSYMKGSLEIAPIPVIIQGDQKFGLMTAFLDVA